MARMTALGLVVLGVAVLVCQPVVEAQLGRKGSRFNEIGTKTTTLDHIEGTSLRVIGAEAAVDVRFTKITIGEVMVQARVRAQVAAGLERVEIVADRDGDGNLTIHVTGPTGNDNPAWEVERISITMPRVVRFEIKTSSGDVRVRGHNPIVDSEGGGGDMGVLPDPPLFGTWFSMLGASTISTVSGDIELMGCAGPVGIETGAGEVSLKNHHGPLDIQTTSGDVEAHGLTQPFSVWTRSGEIGITIKREFEGPITAYTTSGSIELEPAVPMRTGSDAGVISSSATTATSDITIGLDVDR